MNDLQPILNLGAIWLIRIVLAAVAFYIGYWLTTYAQKVVGLALQRHDPETAGTLKVALDRIVRIGGILLSLSASLAFLGVDLGALLASLGLVTVGIAFALKDTIEQLFVGLYILFQRPFKPGDIVRVLDIEGFVENVDIRTTDIRTYDGLLIMVPNKKFFENNVTKRTHYPTRRYQLDVGIAYNNDLPKAQRVILEAVQSTAGILGDPAPTVAAERFDDYAVRLAVRYWIEWQKTDPPKTQADVIASILEATRREDIAIPLPIRTVYLQQSS